MSALRNVEQQATPVCKPFMQIASPYSAHAITCVSSHRICNIANSEIISNGTKIRSFLSIGGFSTNRCDFLPRNSTIFQFRESRHSYANHSVVSPRCYPFGNLRVANFAVIPVVLESTVQGDALRNRPNLPLIYMRHNAPSYRRRSAKLNHFLGSLRTTCDRALTRTVMSHELICVATRSLGQSTWTIYSQGIANNYWLEWQAKEMVEI